MARIKKPSGRLNSGPFTADHFHRALESDGWTRFAKFGHWHYRHPDRPGRKPQVDSKWTAIKTGHDGFKGVLTHSGYTKRELLELLDQASR